MDDLTVFSKNNTVDEWKQAILTTLGGHKDRRCSLLALMSAAKLQSRSIKHPFNEALDTLINEKRVSWIDVPGQPIQIAIIV